MWTIEQATSAVTAGTANFTVSDDTVNILSAVIRETSGSTNTDISIERISREEYLNVPNKTVQARPSQYYVERTNTPKVYLYPAADKAYTFLYYRIRRIQDAGIYTNETDVNFRFLPCIVSGLAYQLSLKFAPERTTALKQFYEEDFARAAAEDRDTASVSFVPDLGG